MSGFGVRIILATRNEFGPIPSASFPFSFSYLTSKGNDTHLLGFL